jgi:hypothetical protein
MIGRPQALSPAAGHADCEVCVEAVEPSLILGVSLDASFPRSTADPILFEGNIAAAECARKSERPASGTFLHSLYRDVRGAHFP